MLKSKQRISDALFLTCTENLRKSVRVLFLSYLCRVNETVRCSNAVNLSPKVCTSISTALSTILTYVLSCTP